MFTITNHFQTTFSPGGGEGGRGESKIRYNRWLWITRRKTLKIFVQEFGLRTCILSSIFVDFEQLTMFSLFLVIVPLIPVDTSPVLFLWQSGTCSYCTCRWSSGSVPLSVLYLFLLYLKKILRLCSPGSVVPCSSCTCRWSSGSVSLLVWYLFLMYL